MTLILLSSLASLERKKTSELAAKAPDSHSLLKVKIVKESALSQYSRKAGRESVKSIGYFNTPQPIHCESKIRVLKLERKLTVNILLNR